jgi:RNase H-fold protein (predicted Holliday junction resolvase)
MKIMQEKACADRKASQKDLKEIKKANQEEILFRMQEMIDSHPKNLKEDNKFAQSKMRSIVEAIKEKMDACILPRNDRGTSIMQGANLSGHEGLPQSSRNRYKEDSA